MTTQEELRALMAEHGLTRAAVAQLAGRAEVTIDSWLAPPGARLHRPMQQRDLDLIRFRLAARNKRRASQLPRR